MKIHSFEHFLYSLTTYAFEEYLKQTNPLNLKQMQKMQKIIIEQERDSLGKFLQEIRKI
jgi:hypothetical protein